MPAHYDCEVCDVRYVEVRATLLSPTGTDESVTVGVARDSAGDINQVCLTKSRLASQRIIFDEWGYGQLKPKHQLNHIVPSTNPDAAAHWCAKLTNIWRLPPVAWRDDMDDDQPIIVTMGRWLGTRGTATKEWQEGQYSLRLLLAPGKIQNLNGQRRGGFGWTYRNDDKTDYASVLPRKLQFTEGELVWVEGDDGFRPIPCRIVTTGIDPNGNEIRWARPLAGGMDRQIDTSVRGMTDDERAAYLESILDD